MHANCSAIEDLTGYLGNSAVPSMKKSKIAGPTGNHRPSERRPPQGERRGAVSLEDLTKRNIETITQLEEAAEASRTVGDRMAGKITAVCRLDVVCLFARCVVCSVDCV